MRFSIGVQELLFVLLPLVLLLFWLISLFMGRYRTNLILSILLVLFDLPYTIGFISVLSGKRMFGFTSLSYSLFLGLICFILGVLGIISYVNRL